MSQLRRAGTGGTSDISSLSRRRFLAEALAAGAAVSMMGSRVEAADTQARKFKIQLSPGMIGIRANLNDQVALASQFGFEAIEPSTGELASMKPEDFEKLREDMKAKNLVWGSTAMSMPFNGSDEAFKTFVEKLPGIAQTLQKAGANRIGTWLIPGDRQLTYVENFRRTTKRLVEVCKIFDDHAIVFGLEYLGPKTIRERMKYPFVHTMRETKELIAETGAKNLGFMLDSWHCFNSSETPEDVKSLTNHDVVYVHLNDAPAGIPLDQQVDSHRALPASTGVINIGGFPGALIEIGYDGPAAAEPFDNSLRQMPRDQAVKKTIDAIHVALAKA